MYRSIFQWPHATSCHTWHVVQPEEPRAFYWNATSRDERNRRRSKCKQKQSGPVFFFFRLRNSPTETTPTGGRSSVPPTMMMTPYHHYWLPAVGYSVKWSSLLVHFSIWLIAAQVCSLRRTSVICKQRSRQDSVVSSQPISFVRSFVARAFVKWSFKCTLLLFRSRFLFRECQVFVIVLTKKFWINFSSQLKKKCWVQRFQAESAVCCIANLEVRSDSTIQLQATTAEIQNFGHTTPFKRDIAPVTATAKATTLLWLNVPWILIKLPGNNKKHSWTSAGIVENCECQI